MANVVIQEAAVTVDHYAIVAMPVPLVCGPALKKVPIVAPGGSFAGGGPTQGQLFPVGNR